ncbi:MAG: phosphoribosylformylglycinamidine synthase subunit PurQ [Nitrospirota bacterium]
MRVGVIVFPGSNCDQDCLWALRECGFEAVPLWHQQAALDGCDAVVLPGGFSYGDYLRCGAIARFSPVMAAVKRHADGGGAVVGICNGFQILTEAGLLPGTLLRNEGLRFLCRPVTVRVEQAHSALTRRCRPGDRLSLPIAHAEGRYWAPPEVLDRLEAQGQVVFRYCASDGALSPDANPNGSSRHIAGVSNRLGNVVGLMPHPERAIDRRLGGEDGRCLIESLLATPLADDARPKTAAAAPLSRA